MAGVDEVRYTGRCPRFGRCSVNSCPPDLTERPTHPKDREKTCQAHLRNRLAILEEAKGDGIALPLAGLRRDEAERIRRGETLQSLVAEWDAYFDLQAKKAALGRAKMRPKAKASPTGTLPASLAPVLLLLAPAGLLLLQRLAQGVLL